MIICAGVLAVAVNRGCNSIFLPGAKFSLSSKEVSTLVDCKVLAPLLVSSMLHLHGVNNWIAISYCTL